VTRLREQLDPLRFTPSHKTTPRRVRARKAASGIQFGDGSGQTIQFGSGSGSGASGGIQFGP
jgi:hypothetical protein